MKEDHPVFTAVQEDATSFCMDWPVFGSDGTDDNQFHGTVFVLDYAEARICDAPLTTPSNRAADEALNRIGWTRCGAWHRDSFGRQSAKVIAVGASTSVSGPWERSTGPRLGSLAEEAALHLA
jgi:hypothetical protein